MGFMNQLLPSIVWEKEAALVAFHWGNPNTFINQAVGPCRTSMSSNPMQSPHCYSFDIASNPLLQTLKKSPISKDLHLENRN